MPTFKLSIDLTGHVHEHAPAAHRATVAQLLDQAKQAFGSGSATRGDLTLASPNVPIQVIGSWRYVVGE
jgi:hypothetical protein